ncbi:MAG TPA: hypothetical protein VMT34_10645 [Aggregatilineales bacterium]|nr:hypothetical protein [Aggregatilineales bacterium]
MLDAIPMVADAIMGASVRRSLALFSRRPPDAGDTVGGRIHRSAAPLVEVRFIVRICG